MTGDKSVHPVFACNGREGKARAVRPSDLMIFLLVIKSVVFVVVKY
jgi:hypothetical protein